MLHMSRPGNWTRPAGKSPARVSARAPGSRPRLDGFLVKRHGRNLRPGRAKRWMEDWFNSHGLYRLRGTIRYPEAALPCEEDQRQAGCGRTARPD